MRNLKLICALAVACTSLINPSTNAYATFEPMLDETALDRTVDPCTDFYAFSCRGWLNRTELPGDHPSWTRSFSTINEENLGELRKILESYAAHDYTLQSHYSKKLGDFYAACMNTQAMESTHTDFLRREFAVIEATKPETLSQVVGDLLLKGYSVLFSIGSTLDFKDSSRIIAEVDQGGLGLPNRDYYFDADKSQIREKYQAHITRMLEFAGIKKDQAQKDALSILTFETALAKNSLSPVDRRDPQNIYHLLPKSQLNELVSVLNWESIFNQVGAPAFENLNIATPDFLRGLNTLLSQAPLEQMQAYFRWHILHSTADKLGPTFEKENFDFYGKTLSGQKEMKPRWKTCVNSTDKSLQDALGEAFVKKTFGEAGKTQTLSILKSIQNAFKENLTSVSWMDDATRQYAITKLEAIQHKMGYPEKWTDFSTLHITPKSHIANGVETARFWTLKEMKKIGQPVNRTEWDMTPPTVNAYYDSQKNEIVFPAGILQSPFFQANASLAANYGAIGMVIGHELTHGFDDQGRQFDAQGNLKDWWTPTVGQVFNQKTQCLVDQYSTYPVADGVHINGKLTLGENLADLGGLKLAYAAYRLAANASPQEATSDFTGEQKFFLSFAQSWCNKSTVEIEKLLAATDPHSSSKYRVNGVVTNLPEFEKAFGCQPGSAMAPVQRCSVW